MMKFTVVYKSMNGSIEEKIFLNASHAVNFVKEYQVDEIIVTHDYGTDVSCDAYDDDEFLEIYE
jgi:hypothetical protein